MSRFLIHNSVKESIIRLYDPSLATTAQEAFNNREEYDVEFIVDWLTPSVVYVSGLMARVNLIGQDFKDVKGYLKSIGAKQMLSEVDGKMDLEEL